MQNDAIYRYNLHIYLFFLTFKMMFMRKMICTLTGLLIIIASWGQFAITVSGKVTDSKDSSPLSGVSVTTKDGKIGVKTDSSGFYTITVSSDKAILVFSCVGYRQIEHAIGKMSSLNISLESSVDALNGVVVVGYQTVKRKDVIGSVGLIANKEIADKPIANFTQLLQGTSPGVQVTGASGRPGASAYIRIRGTGSINASSEPLIIIDGMQVTSTAYALLNPNDIEEISLLKDASATAIYGSRGGNGVLLVTTKKGKGSSPTISYSFLYSQQKALDLKNVSLMNSQQKLQYEYEGGFTNAILDSMIKNRINAGVFPVGSTLSTLSDAQRQSIWDLATSRGAGDWKKYMLQKGISKTHEISISGAGEKFNYYMSLVNSDQEGVAYHNFFKRRGGRINVEYKANDWFKIGTNLGVYNTRENIVRELFNGQAAYTSALLLNPYEPVYNADGTFNRVHLGQNAMETVDNNPDIVDRIATFGNIFGEIKALKHLTIRSQLGLNYNTLSEEYYLKPGSYLAGSLGYNQKRDNGNRDFLYVFTNTANWNQTIGDKHTINVLAGTEFSKDKFYSYSLTSRGFPTGSVNTLENGSTPFAATTSRTDFSLISYFTRLGYDYGKKYFIELSTRRDGSSKFGKDNRFANFWAMGVSWDIKNESFCHIKPISALRLRASVGTTGNNNGIGEYDALGTYALNVNYNGQPAASPAGLPNSALTWEQNDKFDIGLDFGLFKGRLNGTIDVYSNKTKNLLYPVNVSQTTGFASYSGNVGNIQNKGIELSLSGDIVKTKDWMVNVFANYTHNDNKITSLYSDDVPVKGGISILKVGQPVYVYKLVRWAGVNPATGKNEFYKLNGTKTDVFSSGDAVVLDGKSNQVKYYGAFGANITYKGFNLSTKFYYSGGNYIYNIIYATGTSEGESIAENQFTDALHYWKQPGDNVSMANLKDPSQRATYDSDKYLEKGDYVSLRDVTLSYSLDPQIAKKIKLKGVRFFVQGTNLWLGTKFRGLPEVGEANREQAASTTGTYTIPGQITLYSYPQFRAVTFGLNIKL